MSLRGVISTSLSGAMPGISARITMVSSDLLFDAHPVLFAHYVWSTVLDRRTR